MRIRDGRGILILDHQGIGNVVLSLPLLRSVRDWARGRWPVWVLLNSPHVFDLLAEEEIEATPVYYQADRGAWRNLITLRGLLKQRIDLVIAVPQIHPLKAAMLARALDARYTVAESLFRWSWALSSSVRKTWTKPILESQEQMASALGIKGRPGSPSIRLRGSELNWARATLAQEGVAEPGHTIGLHCSSKEPSKRWKAANFGAVIGKLRVVFPGLAVSSFGSEAERKDAEEARLAAGPGPWLEGAGRWTIRQSLALLSQCDLVITADTGVMHMAAAVGARTLSLFGPTSANRIAPRYNVSTALFPRISCSPCYRDSYRRCSCTDLITPDQVANAALELLCASLGDAPYLEESGGAPAFPLVALRGRRA